MRIAGLGMMSAESEGTQRKREQDRLSEPLRSSDRMVLSPDALALYARTNETRIGEIRKNIENGKYEERDIQELVARLILLDLSA
jgi:hypothetical protein